MVATIYLVATCDGCHGVIPDCIVLRLDCRYIVVNRDHDRLHHGASPGPPVHVVILFSVGSVITCAAGIANCVYLLPRKTDEDALQDAFICSDLPLPGVLQRQDMEEAERLPVVALCECGTR